MYFRIDEVKNQQAISTVTLVESVQPVNRGYAAQSRLPANGARAPRLRSVVLLYIAMRRREPWRLNRWGQSSIRYVVFEPASDYLLQRPTITKIASRESAIDGAAGSFRLKW